MDNKDIEVLDDFDFEDSSIDNISNPSNIADNSVQNPNVQEIKKEVTPIEPVTSEIDEKKEEEANPVVEMINNKTTMRLIAFLLIVLFIAVFFMPQIFELIGNR